MTVKLYVPKVGFKEYNTGYMYMPRFGYFDTTIPQVFKPSVGGGLLILGRGFERSINRGTKR